MLKHFDRERLIWDADLNTNESFLLLALNSFVDGNGECWPGQETLSRMCKFTARTVRNTVKSLEAKGIIQKKHRYTNGHRASDLYKVNFSKLSEFALLEPIPELEEASEFIPEQDSTSIPEQDSTMGVSYRKMTTFIPENDDIHTGTIFQGSIHRSTQDLTSKNKSARERICDPTKVSFAPWFRSESFIGRVRKHMLSTPHYEGKQINDIQVKSYMRKAASNLERLDLINDLWELELSEQRKFEDRKLIQESALEAARKAAGYGS